MVKSCAVESLLRVGVDTFFSQFLKHISLHINETLLVTFQESNQLSICKSAKAVGKTPKHQPSGAPGTDLRPSECVALCPIVRNPQIKVFWKVCKLSSSICCLSCYQHEIEALLPEGHPQKMWLLVLRERPLMSFEPRAAFRQAFSSSVSPQTREHLCCHIDIRSTGGNQSRTCICAGPRIHV